MDNFTPPIWITYLLNLLYSINYVTHILQFFYSLQTPFAEGLSQTGEKRHHLFGENGYIKKNQNHAVKPGRQLSIEKCNFANLLDDQNYKVKIICSVIYLCFAIVRQSRTLTSCKRIKKSLFFFKIIYCQFHRC